MEKGTDKFRRKGIGLFWLPWKGVEKEKMVKDEGTEENEDFRDGMARKKVTVKWMPNAN